MGTIPSIVTANSSAEPDSGRRNNTGPAFRPALFTGAGATPQPAKRKPPRP